MRQLDHCVTTPIQKQALLITKIGNLQATMNLEAVESRLAKLESWVSRNANLKKKKEFQTSKSVGRDYDNTPGQSKYRREETIPKVERSLKPPFHAIIGTAKSTLRQQEPATDGTTVKSLLARLREEEQRHSAELGSLNHQLQKERRRAHNAERAAALGEQRLDYRLNEVKHLREALKQRDILLQTQQEQIKELEMGVASAEALREAQGQSRSSAIVSYARPVRLAS
jgi:chromosome segregation ATPase